MNDNKIIRLLIPVIAVVVLVESVIFLSNSVKKVGPQPLKPASNRAVDLTWVAEKSVVTGKSQEVAVKISASKQVAVDSVDLYIKYDPTRVTVSGVSFDDSMVKPSFSKVSQEKGMVVANFLVSAPKGYELKPGVMTGLAKLKVNYIAAGQTKFLIGEGTLVVENGSAKMLPFNSQDLEVSVSQ